MTIDEAIATAEMQLRDGCAEAIERCIAILKSEDDNLPPSVESTIRNFGPSLFHMGATFALKTYDCYPKT